MVTKLTPLVLAACGALALAGCTWLTGGDGCERGHGVLRAVEVDGLRDTLRAGDTLRVSAYMPWVAESIPNSRVDDQPGGEIIDLRRLDTLVFPMQVFGTYAPFGGPAAEPENPIGGDSGREWAFRPGDIVARTGVIFFASDGSNAVLQGDRADTAWQGAFDLVFRRPGRYFVRFIAGSEGGDVEEDPGRFDAPGITEPGCNETVSVGSALVGYRNNLDMIARAERASSVKIRTNVSADRGEFYIVVVEE